MTRACVLRHLFALLLGTVLTAPAGGPARAQWVSIDTLAEQCRLFVQQMEKPKIKLTLKQEQKAARCIGYIHAVHDTLFGLDSTGKGRMGYCLSKDSKESLFTYDIARGFSVLADKYGKQHGGAVASILVMRVLKIMHKCKP